VVRLIHGKMAGTVLSVPESGWLAMSDADNTSVLGGSSTMTACCCETTACCSDVQVVTSELATEMPLSRRPSASEPALVTSFMTTAHCTALRDAAAAPNSVKYTKSHVTYNVPLQLRVKRHYNQYFSSSSSSNSSSSSGTYTTYFST